ncbi:MAG: hypothetical protein U0236_11820 [Nitrospira sp.]
MSQLSDHEEQSIKKPRSGSSMSNKGFPGLVMVPPSDRTILRRRLLRGALVLVTAIWAASTFITRSPTPDDNTPCPTEAGQSSTESSPDGCATPASPPEANQRPSELNRTEASPVTAPVEAASLPAEPHSDPERLQAKPLVEQPLPTHTESTEPRTESPAENPEPVKPARTRLSEKPAVNLESDTHLAEQGDAFAQYRLGRRVAQQEGRQAPEAISWYKKAFTGLHRLAESGNGQAMYVLGVMYAYGRGVERDIGQARRWLTRAVDQKVTAAQPVLASLPASARSSPNLQIHAAESAKPRKQQN